MRPSQLVKEIKHLGKQPVRVILRLLLVLLMLGAVLAVWPGVSAYTQEIGKQLATPAPAALPTAAAEATAVGGVTAKRPLDAATASDQGPQQSPQRKRDMATDFPAPKAPSERERRPLPVNGPLQGAEPLNTPERQASDSRRDEPVSEANVVAGPVVAKGGGAVKLIVHGKEKSLINTGAITADGPGSSVEATAR